jgi:brefeldin A-resistance guanine nucleotide exchange factor 1
MTFIANIVLQEEAVPESLKNILLVMSSSGYLVPPSVDPTHEKLWVETWKRLSRFLPDLRKELDLDPPVEKPTTEQSPQEEDSTPPVAPVS